MLIAANLPEENYMHDELIRFYDECNIVEKLLHNQLLDGIPATYLDTLRNNVTNMINDPIFVIINSLVQNYCKVNPKKITEANKPWN